MKIRSSNKKFFLNILASVLIVYGASMVPPLLVALFLDESYAVVSLGTGAAICLLAGIITRKLLGMTHVNVKPRMNYRTTVFIWIIIIIITAVIFYAGKAETEVADSLFQAAASLTTTGSGITDISAYPLSFKLWRSVLNWLGGIGLILTGASLLQGRGSGGHSLISVEMPGSDYLILSGSYKSTYRNIISIYAGLTAAQFILLLIAGMDPFDSVLTALSNISTAGMQHINNGVITGLSIHVKIIITVFAFLGSLNISLIILLLMHKTDLIKRRNEIKIYTAMIVIAALFIAAVIAVSGNGGFFSSFGESLMQTVSFLSTSGYIVTDCYEWPFICRLLIIMLVFSGACSVSTGGGIKTARTEIALKTISFGMFRHIHPRSVRPVKHDKTSLKTDQFAAANLYTALFMLVFIAGALILSIDNKNESILDALNYSQAMITNTGSSIADPETMTSAVQFSPLSKIAMSFEMLAGRLEIYPVLMLLSRSFWKSEKNY